MQVGVLTVGPLQENCYLVTSDDGARAFFVDPGDEGPRLLAALDQTGASLEAILLTHCHFDHVGAVAEVARATGAPVWVPELERDVLANINDHVRFEGFGPFEDHEAEHTVAGGETLEIAGVRLEVRFAPGHSPGHVVYVAGDHGVMFGGDVLFEGSVGRTDLPGGDHAELLRSIQALLDELPDETHVLPGHMGPTTLGRERAANPFLRQLQA